jgi:hypothetical protein
MKFNTTVGPSIRFLSNISSNSSIYTISTLDGLADQLSGCSGI